MIERFRHNLALRIAPWLEPQDSREWAETTVKADLWESQQALLHQLDREVTLSPDGKIRL